ncbi:hypothetical protein DYI37_02295 [Fulvimarina endophytica]|uniref:Ancillary SecYEG translocon subunit/Cell division coordinator CpoB TPR domain-containing protein n=1 Tax=Fulvimarina endophytica TaxID=2293836 RepID=A0A371XAT5_9HYPH|nr:tetratricopeptide repeat protein [Fulvimarina endophytica]RFC66302.1 hypothetical protein DYI37_02295 [Fulvimarina endophytica]
MSDESFFREVSEELRQDRLKSIWTRFGAIIIAVVAVVVLGTAGYVGWERYAQSQANASGDRYLAAQDLVTSGDVDGAVLAFRELAADGWGAYPNLARMSIANAYASEGRSDEAVAAYSEVAADSSVPAALREMADLHAAYILVDSGSVADVRAKAERLTGDDNALRYAARDAIGLAAWKAGDTEAARDLYQSIADAGDVPQGIAQRAQLILGLISGAVPAEAAPQAASTQNENATPDAASTPSGNGAEAGEAADGTATTQPEAAGSDAGSAATSPTPDAAAPSNGSPASSAAEPATDNTGETAN